MSIPHQTNRRQTNHHHTSHQKRASVIRNERMTALAGAILFIIIIGELVITANLHTLLTVHIFIGVLLAGPVVVKMSSTGYRFFRYYTKSPSFVQSGTPNIWLRLLAPVLVLFTILVFASGFSLALVGPTHMGLFFKIHAASVAVWIPLLAVHVYAHFRQVPRRIANDWTSQSVNRVSGRKGRIAMNLAGLGVGLVAAIVMMPVSAPWHHWRIGAGLPSPLVAGIIGAVCAVLVAIPILRKAK